MAQKWLPVTKLQWNCICIHVFIPLSATEMNMMYPSSLCKISSEEKYQVTNPCPTFLAIFWKKKGRFTSNSFYHEIGSVYLLTYSLPIFYSGNETLNF
jgi:hypothetical protein